MTKKTGQRPKTLVLITSKSLYCLLSPICRSILMLVMVGVINVVVIGIVMDLWWCWVVSWCGGWLSVDGWSCWSYLIVDVFAWTSVTWMPVETICQCTKPLKPVSDPWKPWNPWPIPRPGVGFNGYGYWLAQDNPGLPVVFPSFTTTCFTHHNTVSNLLLLSHYLLQVAEHIKVTCPTSTNMHVCIAIQATEPGIYCRLVFFPVELMMTLVTLGFLESFFTATFLS